MRSARRWAATLRRASASAPADRSPASMRARGKASAARMAGQPEPVQRSSTRRDLARIADRQHAVRRHVADEGARDQRPPVGMEAHAMHVGRAHQIGRGQAQAARARRSGSAAARARPRVGREVEIGIDGGRSAAAAPPAPGRPPRRARWSCRGRRPAAPPGSAAPRTGRFHPGCRERVCWRPACRPRLPDMNRRAFLIAVPARLDIAGAGARARPISRSIYVGGWDCPPCTQWKNTQKAGWLRLARVPQGDLGRGQIAQAQGGLPGALLAGRPQGRCSTSCRARAARRAS